ncbi:electron transfer flavoprotein subunit alpha/FixB family protein [Ilumatobacter nonamiensis]|uniref:electron transfer flavoprotein subunit alpha/FixB family protein n=1 Tax=Ilumatobacter nonamiensis TaxID=467093 RepID=UPI00058C82A6|nr:electron transfer flavoprotein subunit alpha/FixB family protein [Ilumatobacter nonamiensis]
MSVLVVVEHDRGEMADASLEAFAFAGDLGAQLGVDVEALLIGASAGALADACAAHGAVTVHHTDHEALVDYGPEAYGFVVAAAVESLSPAAVVASGTDRGNEVLASAAARLDLPFVANCLSVTAESWEVTRVQWGGSLNEVAHLESATPVLSVAPHAVTSNPPADGSSASVQTLDVDLPDSVVATMIQDRIVLSEGVTLATAPVVVGGGRGVGSAEGFDVLEALAGRLGGVVGCSRAVTNNGWRPHSDQVGQTGTRIAPQLYIACGISGAIQHWVGAKAAKKILAINTDPAANMVVKADYAIIGDLFEVLPAITAEL